MAFRNFINFTSIARKFVIVGDADYHIMREVLAHAQCRSGLVASLLSESLDVPFAITSVLACLERIE